MLARYVAGAALRARERRLGAAVGAVHVHHVAQREAACVRLTLHPVACREIERDVAAAARDGTRLGADNGDLLALLADVVGPRALLGGPVDRPRNAVEADIANLRDDALPSPRTVEVPVCYGGDLGPDLEDVARQHGLDPDTVVRLHAAGGQICSGIIYPHHHHP